MSKPTVEQINKTFLAGLVSDDPGMQKQSADAIDGYTRLKVREEGFARKIIQPMNPTDSQLSRTVDSDMPVVIMDKEPDNPPAYSIPFATAPKEHYIRGPKYRVMFSRIATRKFRKDVEELRTYNMDLRQIISDNAIKDIHTEEDEKFIMVVNDILGGAPFATQTETGAVQWGATDQEITRSSIAESLKLMPSTPYKLRPAVALINHISVMDVLKFTRDQAGGDLSQDMLLNGFTQQKIMGINWVVTIKHELVPTDTIYYFAEPKFLGVFFTLTDITMHIDRKNGYMIEFFAYEVIGSTIANGGAVARYDFNVGDDSD